MTNLLRPKHKGTNYFYIEVGEVLCVCPRIENRQSLPFYLHWKLGGHGTEGRWLGHGVSAPAKRKCKKRVSCSLQHFCLSCHGTRVHAMQRCRQAVIVFCHSRAHPRYTDVLSMCIPNPQQRQVGGIGRNSGEGLL